MLPRLARFLCCMAFVESAAFLAGGLKVDAQIQVAEALLVELNASDPSAGTPVWINTAPESIGDFIEVGDPIGLPIVEEVAGVMAVTFNSTDIHDAYQSEADAPEGIIGPDPTRSIEVWAYNPVVADEETLLAWGSRGGPDGTNMSFNYGVNPMYGAIGHWGGAGPDIGWNDGGGAPAAGQWHHLVYTYDGTTTRVYSDGCIVEESNCEWNSEELGAGVINTFGPTRIVLSAQLEAGGVTLNFPLRGTLSIARVRIHDGVLTPAQIQNNYDFECPELCPPPGTCGCDNCPDTEDFHYRGQTRYSRKLRFSGFPAPTFTATAPPGAAIAPDGLLTYTLPDPQVASFNVSASCSNSEGTSSFSWKVTLVDPPPRADIQIAGELLVDLDAEADTAGTPVWLSNGSVGSFIEIGDPFTEALGPEGSPAVVFNGGATDDAYQSSENAPAGIVGINPTRSIEVWAFNPEVGDEETLLAWGRRGGPDGSNMSFNYGGNAMYGAVGHWGGAGPDLGWDNAGGAPEAGVWHHLVYTFDGDATATTRVYVDGILANSELLGPGVINTHADHPITLAVQIANAAGALDFSVREGSLGLGQVRIHDGVLSPSQVFHNFNAERGDYGLPEPNVEPPAILNAPDSD
ncbi:MAG TPA: LamG-like jellyroll fold domain-containing protein, partial [Planctomycetota bacterium]|nr:LamG-like jellyroll fold domain-containing protein [Planctomycetota bacterium]